MQAPLMTDTEAETSMELDADEPSQITRDAPNFTKSIFNIAFENLLQQQESVEVKDYESRLQQEIKEWETIWRQSFNNAKKAREKLAPINVAILAPEKRAYLDKMPNLQTFINESKEFRHEAHCFLEKYVEEFEEKQQNLLALCEYVSDTAKHVIIQKQYANDGHKDQAKPTDSRNI